MFISLIGVVNWSVVKCVTSPRPEDVHMCKQSYELQNYTAGFEKTLKTTAYRPSRGFVLYLRMPVYEV